MGHPQPDRPVITARLGERWTSPAGRRQFRRAVLDAVRGTVREVGGPPSHLLASLARADCLVEVPEESTELAAGDAVQVWLLDG
jgi:molybdopterin molybdotransferase